MKIAELSRVSGTHRSTIHHYLDLGLLPRPETLGPRLHHFGDEHVERLREIKALRAQGLGLGEIRQRLATRLRPRTPHKRPRRRRDGASDRRAALLERGFKGARELWKLGRSSRPRAEEAPPVVSRGCAIDGRCCRTAEARAGCAGSPGVLAVPRRPGDQTPASATVAAASSPTASVRIGPRRCSTRAESARSQAGVLDERADAAGLHSLAIEATVVAGSMALTGRRLQRLVLVAVGELAGEQERTADESQRAEQPAARVGSSAW
ncbi:MerR family transcriptional regulator [Nannocystis sp. RBIL2]|uniref:MerR family transcriptional regulator n=1 Tax=Nannocystis sp. RBIL2 TaxID=2996788 RepID=UPI002271BE96|nr:MerR family transcriptional regulator [Nannocystis sp. RBIL2]MCY1064859.1 MerR family transcriptional regulator [Nannocystis sp. RBIL2]